MTRIAVKPSVAEPETHSGHEILVLETDVEGVCERRVQAVLVGLTKVDLEFFVSRA